jgi:hemoglobin
MTDHTPADAPAACSFYDRLGGDAAVRAIIDDFVERVFDDIMIGFFFRNASKPRVKEFEFQHASEFLGGPAPYQGRPLKELHARHPIMGGHFARRLQLLRQVLSDHGVPDDIRTAWVDHNAALRPEITR